MFRKIQKVLYIYFLLNDFVQFRLEIYIFCMRRGHKSTKKNQYILTPERIVGNNVINEKESGFLSEGF